MNATTPGITVRPLREEDLPAADHIMRLAFGTFLGLPEPASFMGDAGYVRARWRADPRCRFRRRGRGRRARRLELRYELGQRRLLRSADDPPRPVGSGRGQAPDGARHGVLRRWGTAHAGLFTFAHSQKHVGLYQKFGFWPRFLTAIMSKPVETAKAIVRVDEVL